MKRLISVWIKEARWFVGMDFVPDTLKATIAGDAIKLIEVGAPLVEAKRLVFRELYRYGKTPKYVEERNRRNWRWRVARSQPTPDKRGE